MEGASNKPFVQGSQSGQPQQYMSISGLHTSEAHLQAHNVELKE